jgi:hypothetical protein
MSTKHRKTLTVGLIRIDGHRLSEFIYGTVTGLVTIAGINDSHSSNWVNAAAIIIFGAVAIWIAHAYSILVSKRVIARISVREMTETLAGSWPIVIAGGVLALPLLLVALGLISLSFGLQISRLIGITILALVGFLAGVITREKLPLCLLLALLSAGLGIAVVAIEFFFHH